MECLVHEIGQALAQAGFWRVRLVADESGKAWPWARQSFVRRGDAADCAEIAALIGGRLWRRNARDGCGRGEGVARRLPMWRSFTAMRRMRVKTRASWVDAVRAGLSRRPKHPISLRISPSQISIIRHKRLSRWVRSVCVCKIRRAGFFRNTNGGSFQAQPHARLLRVISSSMRVRRGRDRKNFLLQHPEARQAR